MPKITQKMLNGYAGKPQVKGTIIRDTELKGFGLRISPKGAISFIVEARPRGVGGSAKRITVGKYPAFSLVQAREEAREALRILYAGKDPKAVKKSQIDISKEAQEWTLERVFNEMLERRDLKASTRKDYIQGLHYAYSEYLSKPIQSITRADVEKVYWSITKGQNGSDGSLSSAQRTSRILSSVMSYAKGIELSNGDRLITQNPVEVLKDKGVKRTLPRKVTVIPPEELKVILDRLHILTVGQFGDDTIRTNKSFLRAFYVLALTGARKMEVFTLRKEDVHLDTTSPYVQFNDTKNHQVHYVPLTESLLLIIQNAMETDGPWLFPGADVKHHIENPAKAVKRYLGGYSLHDLRRTFLTVGSEIGVDTMALKKLVNHKTSDITEGYIIQRKEQKLKLTLAHFETIQAEMLSLSHVFPDLS